MKKAKPRAKCRDCKDPPESGRSRCRKHLDYHNEKSKVLTETRRDKRVAGICYDCSELVADGKTRCSSHLQSSAQATSRYLSSGKGLEYLSSSAERRKETDRKSAAKCKRGKGRFAYVKWNAVENGKVWSLTKDEYHKLIVEPCHYCELKNDVEAGVGLDRLDNAKGYIQGNVVSCCVDCNYVRGDRFTIEEMKQLGKCIRQLKLQRTESFS